MRIEQVRTDLADRLFARRIQLEAAARERVAAVSADPPEAEEFRQAVSAAVGYGIEALARPAGEPPPLPGILLARARLAAREGDPLQGLIRRYLAGFAVFGDVLLDQLERVDRADGTAVRQLLAALADLSDRVIATIGSEYARTDGDRVRTPVERRAQVVTRLLDDELLDSAGLPYDFGAVHLGLIAEGPSARPAVDRLMADLDTRRLLVQPDADTVWAWLGARRGLDWGSVAERLARDRPGGVTLAIGEPAPSLRGWRLTHRQAEAALPAARAAAQGSARYRDVALLASAHRDRLLRDSLNQLFLEPLAARRDGESLRLTLRAYLDADRNASSAAALLQVDRRTVTGRIRIAEECFGRSLTACSSELHLALQLERLDRAGEGAR